MKKQLSKVLAIALMVACAVAFMPLLNGQVFAAKKPGKAKITSLEQADTANDDGTYAVTVAYKAKKAKKYQVSYTDGTEAKTMKTKKKSVSFNGTVDSTYTVKVRGIKGKKKGKWSAAQEIKVEAKTPGPTGKMEITGITQSGTKQLKVTFGTAVADPSALTFTVTRDGKEITATAKADPNDPNSVLLDLDSAVVDGAKYDVAVKTADGTEVPTAPGAVTEVTGAKEAVDAIEVDPNLVLESDGVNSATVTFVIKNQFGEDVTAKYASKLNVTSTIGTFDPASDLAKGIIRVKDIQQIQTIPGTKGNIVVVYTETGVNTNAEVTVGAAAKINSVAIKGLYDSKGQQTAIIAKAKNDAAVAFELKDQYDRTITATPVDGTDITATVVGGLTGLEKGAIGTVTIDEQTYPTITLAGLNAVKAGNASVIIVANATGAKDQFDFTVGDENVIADLTVTAPADVIGGKDNVFTVEAKNAAGEAITDYDYLSAQITLPEQTGAEGSGIWRWKKEKDGSAQLIFKANEVSKDTLASAVFQTKDTYKTSFITFTVKTGVGIPYEITDILIDEEESGDSYVVLSGIKVVDVYGDEVEVNPALLGSPYRIMIAQPDYTENSKAALYNEEIDEVVGTTRQPVADWYDYFIAATPKLEEGSANAKVNVILQKNTAAPSAEPKWEDVLTSEFTKSFSVIAGVQEFDSYVVKVASWEADCDDVKSIYLPEYVQGQTWVDPDANDFIVELYGKMDGSDREYPVYKEQRDYVVEYSTDAFEDYDYNYFVIGETTAKAGVKDLTINVLIPSKGATPVATTTVAFSSEKPVVTTIDPKENKDLTIGANYLYAEAMGEDITVRDQYGLILYGETPAITLNSVTDAAGNYKAPKTDDVVNYTVNYDGTTHFEIANGTSDGAIAEGDVVSVTATYGDVSADIDFTVSGSAPVPLP